MLDRFYWQGHTFGSIAQAHGLTHKDVTEVRDDALRKLDLHYKRTQAQQLQEQAHRTPQQEAGENNPSALKAPSPPSIVLGEDTRITALRRLGHPDKRREVAGRYPELRPPHGCLNERENDLLELTFWQGRTFAEIASLEGLPRKKVGGGVRAALERLNAHLCRDPHHDEDHLDEVLLALNECGSVRKAARKLGVSRDVLKAFVTRASIKTRFVFEVETSRRDSCSGNEEAGAGR